MSDCDYRGGGFLGMDGGWEWIIIIIVLILIFFPGIFRGGYGYDKCNPC